MRVFISRRLTYGIATGLLATAFPLSADEVPQKVLSPPSTVSPQPAPRSTNATISDPLAKQVEDAIEATAHRFLDTEVHTPWQIVHGLLAYRNNYVIKQRGTKIKALDWIATGPSYQGQPWFEKTSYGAHAHPYNNVPYAFQGHPSQFLAYMTLCNLPLDYKIKVSAAETATIEDFVHGSQLEVNDREEVTWTLWFLSHYLDSDARWVNKNGEPWSLERLVQVETQKNVAAAACGGTHGLFALAYARNGYRASGRPLYGAWLEADQKVRRYIEAARVNQNPDGSFSTTYFQGPGYSREFEKRMSSSGHVLEFLCVALPQSRLSEDWMRNAVAAVAGDLTTNRSAPAECGALYHAVDALQIYRTRVWPELAARQTITAAKPAESSQPPESKAKHATFGSNGVTPLFSSEKVSSERPQASPAR